jgi:glycerophosphoryl diester phosphodiesterase
MAFANVKPVLWSLVGLVAAIYLWNASWLAPPNAHSRARIVSHRGVHQTYDRTALTEDECTATRIAPPSHDLLENTIPSMRAAFEAGAEVVELDVHPTTDGRLAVFHDWTLDCRTNGQGRTRDHSLAELQALDIGFGYTADHGVTFPLRGKGVGLMPSLQEVFAAFPGRRFLINFKSREQREGDMLADLVTRHPEWRGSLFGVYGGEEPTRRAAELLDGLRFFTRRSATDCLVRYLALGWSGHVPQACRSTLVPVPVNVAPFLWGWPSRFQARMRAVGSEVILLGPRTAGDPGSSGLDTLAQLGDIPEGFDGYVWTNRIETMGPALSRGR